MAIAKLLEAAGFRPDAYERGNPDVPAGMGLRHFIDHGADERRLCDFTLNADRLDETVPLPFLAALSHAHLHSLGDGLVRNIEEHWPTIERLRRLGARPVLIIGDSHSNLYRRTPELDGGWILPIALVMTGGSAQGLGNPASRSGYGRIAQDFIDRIGRLDPAGHIPTIFKFGQVDTEFVYTFKRIRSGQREFSMRDYEDFVARTLESYLPFLAAIRRPHQVTGVASVFPPSLSDRCWQEGYVNGHIAGLEGQADLDALREAIKHLVIPDLQTRTGMHRHFNEALRAGLGRHLPDAHYLDDFEPLIGPRGTVDARFIARSQGADHHVDFEHCREPIDRILRRFVEEN